MTEKPLKLDGVVILAGSRNITDYKTIVQAIEKSGFKITRIIEGGARGVDRLARIYAIRNGIEFTTYGAEWDKFGKSAGYRRNVDMSEDPQVTKLIAIWDGISKGTKHMIDIATRKGLEVFIYLVHPH